MRRSTSKTFVKDIPGAGRFVFKYPTLHDELKADALTAKLLQDNPNPSVIANNIATMMAALEVAIVQKPEDFKLEELYTYDELKSVYDPYVETVLAFREPGRDKEAGTEEGTQPQVLVSPEVQPSTHRPSLS